MGNSAASGFASVTFTKGNATTAGAQGGTSMHTLTTAEIPAHTHGSSAHTHDITMSETNINQGSGGSTAALRASGTSTTASASHTHTSVGSDTAHPNMPPFALGTWYMKL